MIAAAMHDEVAFPGAPDALAGDHDAWRRLIDAVGPAWLLVAIRARMSAALIRRYEPDDVLQDTLLHAWRDRRRCTWQGVRAFRAWLLEIAGNYDQILDATDSQPGY
jgi:DNA-directed RNA polymerase specialized sigma24 family protein